MRGAERVSKAQTQRKQFSNLSNLCREQGPQKKKKMALHLWYPQKYYDGQSEIIRHVTDSNRRYKYISDFRLESTHKVILLRFRSGT